MEAGLRVVRGPDWKWSNQDGGEGSVGTIVAVGQTASASSPDKTVVVQWDGGTRTNYRCGYQGAYDLSLLDNGQIGVAHVNISCSECKEQGIRGMRWECGNCEGYNLCTTCYMGNKHQVHHNFYRIESPHCVPVFVGKRYGKIRIQSRGIFPGARVARGPDWDWGDQDGGIGKVGLVTDVKGWDQESFRSVVNVTWSANRELNVYRLGHKGKVDLTCISAAPGGFYYKDQLPKLGETTEAAQPHSSLSSVHSSPFQMGDHVQVLLAEDILKAMQEGHGGWNDKMKEVIGLVGVVHRITENGDVRIQYPGFTSRWTFHPAALTKVKGLQVNDQVILLNDATVVRRAQAGHGEWADTMLAVLGKTGKIVRMYADGDVCVAFGNRTWTFNPSVLMKQEPSTCSPPVTPAATSLTDDNTADLPRDQGAPSLLPLLDSLHLSGRTDVGSVFINAAGQGWIGKVKEILSANPEKVDVDRDGRTALHVASHEGHANVVKFLLHSGAQHHLQDGEGDSPLHYAGFGNQAEVANVLLEAGADPNCVNSAKCTPLHVAVNKDHTGLASVLLEHAADVNLQDSYGDTVLHDAVSRGAGDMINILLNHPQTALDIVNRRGFNPLHQAALRGQAQATTKLLARRPDLVNSRKRDGFTALHLSSLNGHRDVVRNLLAESTCEVDCLNTGHQTPLLLASDKLHIDIARELIAANACVNKMDGFGDTPLHVVVMNHAAKHAAGNQSTSLDSSRNLDLARLLIHHGADPTLPNRKNKSPLQLCRGDDMEAILTTAAENRTVTGAARSRTSVTPSTVHTASAVTPSSSHTSAVTPSTSHTPSAVTPSTSHTPSAVTPSSTVHKSAGATSSLPPTVQCRLCEECVDCKFLPCGHCVVCYECGHLFKKCFQCKLPVESVEKLEAAVVQECLVCSDVPADVVFEPCSHKLVCADCAVRMKKCIMCQVHITRKTTSDGTELVPQPEGCPESIVDTMQSLKCLQARVREMEDANQCPICLENKRNVVFLCGHGTCSQCCRTLDMCPLCRKPIEKKITLFD